MRILLDIDGTIASWDEVAEHGFGPARRTIDPRVPALICQHEVTLFSRNPELAAWMAHLGCAGISKPSPGAPSLRLSGYDVLIDDEADLFAYHCPGMQLFLTLADFLSFTDFLARSGHR